MYEVGEERVVPPLALPHFRVFAAVHQGKRQWSYKAGRSPLASPSYSTPHGQMLILAPRCPSRQLVVDMGTQPAGDAISR
jgi:hypothetical protein